MHKLKSLVNISTLIAMVTLVALVASAPTANAQSPQVTPPKDKDTPFPQHDLYNSLCDECRAKLKKQMKDPNSRPMLGPGAHERHMRHDRRKARNHVKREMHGQQIHRRAEMRRKARRKMHHRMQANDLSEEQRTTLRDMTFEHRKTMIDLKASLNKEQLELKRLMTSDDISDSELRRRVDRVNKRRADIEFEKLKSRLDRKEVLTDEQKEKSKHKKR